ncbi:hypothetical protein [Novosphingobium sp. KN65.2]|uniref:hypothetical protein n=1 Tax=Novosphingobium sp. KN65.2 TaxID=1478134 RepID=UPI0005E8F0D6|nr:hypothetical protein [Novosphingobium sp. KN65.2]CDO36022.1 conserved hypothetical protein [Novosphingobium sp. KN65.2]
MAVDGQDERTTATGLFHFAHSYAASAITLTEHQVRATHRDAPIRYLFAHAAELYLKAFCRLHGVPVRELSGRSLGHNLEALVDKANTLGLGADPKLCACLAAMNNAILHRYIVTGARREPNLVDVRETCIKLNDQVGPLVYTAEGLTRAAPSL